MLWEKVFPRGYGRGALTADGIYVPSGLDKVIKFRLSDGEQEDESGVVLMDNQPVGNLFSNGKRLYSLGLRQVCSLGEVNVELKSDLEKELDANKKK
jgi:hypothetical protein